MTSPQMAVVAGMEQEAIDAGLDIVVGVETTELLADEEFKVFDPYPTKIEVALNAQTRKFWVASPSETKPSRLLISAPF